ncbi:MAG: YfhO family protein [Candidatus Omnitrophica bacterium]|nr:YfhO family protein [Candidatus Omnitrophota bacterium]
MKRRYGFSLILILFSVILLGFFYDIVFLGKTFKISTMYAQALPYGPYGQGGNFHNFFSMIFCDTASLEESFFQFLKINFQNGIFPLWNPHQLCGVPMSLMMEGGIFFPLNALLYVLPNTISFDVLILARILVAGLLMYWLMNVWKFSFFPRIAAALTFMFTGPMVVNQLWTVNAEIFLPLLFIVSYKVFKEPSIKHYVFFSLAIGLNVFSGHVEHIFLTQFLTALYVMFLFWQDVKNKNPNKVKKILILLSFYILGIGISAVVLFPFIADFLRAWTSHTNLTGLENLEPKSKILTMLVPGFFSEGLATDSIRYTWVGGYLGVIVVLLAFLGFWLKERRSLVWFLGGIAIFVFGKMFGFIYAQWIGYLPVFNIILLVWHLSHIFAFLIAFLVGFGVQELLNNPAQSLKRLIAIGIVLIFSILGCLWIYRQEPFFDQAVKASSFSLLILFVACVGLFLLIITRKKKAGWIAVSGLMVLMLLELFVLNPRYRVKRFDSFPRVPYIEFLKNKQKESSFRSNGMFLAFYKNTAMAYGLDSFGGHQSIYPYRYTQFVKNLIDPESYAKIDAGQLASANNQHFDNTAFLSIANVRYIIMGKDINSKAAVYNKEVQIIPLPVTAPRAYLAYNWDFKKKEEVLSVIKERGARIVSRVIIEKGPQEVFPKASVLGQEIITPIKIEKVWANGVVLKADAERSCFLVLLDAYHPGWKVWVDGKPSKVYPANYLFRAVFLEPGKHVIEFRFVPFWFYFGLGVSLFSLGICFFLWIVSRRRKIS